MHSKQYRALLDLYKDHMAGCTDFKTTYYAQERFVEEAKRILKKMDYAQEFITFTDVEGETRFIHIFGWNENRKQQLFVARF
ncbi:MAG: hypothetical protein IJI66_01860 [Erysipelotrichaceae bacterium]|nr:hypothetical protein [Erysipelotrichaceae bacterium]